MIDRHIRPTRSAAASIVLTALISLVGLIAFSYPFLLTAVPSTAAVSVRSTDAPLIFGVLMPLLLALVLAELSSRHMNAKIVAALGVLIAINAVLRLPTGLGDSPTFFFLPILLGYVYGARFGFLHGALSLFVSALLTVGVGPWMPFQMLAMGWLAMGAATIRWLRFPEHSWREVIALAIYSYVACMLFGTLMNMYSWPFLSAAGGLSWEPGLSLLESVRRYWSYYVISGSLAWDALRSISTTALILFLGRPLLRELRRFHARFFWQAERQSSIHERSTS